MPSNNDRLFNTNLLQAAPRRELKSSFGGTIDQRYATYRPLRELPSPLQIRNSAEAEINDYYDTLSIAEQALGSIDVIDDISMIWEILEMVHTAKEACRSKRLSDAKPFKDRLKDVEGVYASVEADLADVLYQLRGGFSDRLADEEIDWEIAEVQAEMVDWNLIGPYLTPAAVSAAARKHMIATGKRDLPGITYRALAKL